MQRTISEKDLEKAKLAGKNPRTKDNSPVTSIKKKEPRPPEYEKILREIVDLFKASVKPGESPNPDLAKILKQITNILDSSLKQAKKTTKSNVDIANATLAFLKSTSNTKQPIDLNVEVEVPEELKTKEPKKIRVHDIKRSNENLIEEFTLEEVK